MFQALIASLALASVGLSAPNNPPSYNKISQTDKFDNIAGVLGVSVAPVNGNGIYMNKKYNGFSIVETLAPATPGVPGVIPQSDPNYIAFSAGDTQTILQGTPAITVDFTDSETAFYDLISFYFGCSLGTEENVASDPVACTMSLVGYGPPPTNAKKATASFNFSPNNGLSVEMQEAILPSSFTGLYRTTFAVEALASNLTAGLIDNVANTVYSTGQFSS